MRWQLGRFLLFVLTTVWCAGQSSAVRAAEPVARAPESTATDVVNAAGTGDQEARDLNWHHWRGPRGDGVAPRATPPASWDTKTNIRWKVPIAGEGSATPIVWGQRVFVVSAVPTDRRAEAPAQPDEQAKTAPPANYHDFTVWCLERATGRVLWKQVRRRQSRMKVVTLRTPMPLGHRSPMASVFMSPLARAASTAMTWMASCSGDANCHV
ncbi:MAG: hypothetical protein ACKPEY_00035 [Planctomycetota bacterium]